jgi:glycosyltransferase involved in cell wall biosynthesis
VGLPLSIATMGRDTVRREQCWAVSRCVGRGNPVSGESAHRPGLTHGRGVSTNERRRNHDLSRANAALPLEHQHSIRTVNSLRVLYLSPWMRPLARVQAEALRRRGVDVLLVTSDQHHPEADAARDYELVLDPRFRSAASWPATLAAWRRVREYRPDVVLAELLRDPRWIALAGRVPRLHLLHDHRPHDPAEQRPVYERAVLDRWTAGSTATVTYSDYVAAEVATGRSLASTRVHVLPLCSDLDPALVPPLVGPEGRHDFVMIGRLNQYKNVDVVLEAWQRHVTGGGWRGDDLVLIGDGPVGAHTLPKHTRWRHGKYRYSDIITTLASAKGSVAHYRRASQSGVQVLSMQLGVMPVVSTAGGLAEFQPPGCPPVGVDDIAGLATAFDELADPCTAARRGAAAARHYANAFAVDRAADGLLNVITEVLAARSPGRSVAAPTAPTSRGAP